MRAFITPSRRIALSLSALALAALSLPVGARAAAVPKKALPRVATGVPSHVLGTSALLTGRIDPSGTETTYYFQYGTTTTYGSQTPTAKVGSGIVGVKVGQTISGLTVGAAYHFRLVATNAAGTSFGHDRTFATKGGKLKILLPKPPNDVFGSPMIISGSLSGLGSARHSVALQASPYPYLESFTSIGRPGLTDSLGRFSFRVSNLTTSTQFRVVTLDALPVFSPAVTVGVAVKVIFHVRSSGHTGLVRLYGTVSPAIHAGQVLFQVQKATRPSGKNEATTRYSTQFMTTLKHGTKSFSRFSFIASIRKGGRYRALIKVHTGGLVSGFSAATFVLRAAPGSGHKK